MPKLASRIKAKVASIINQQQFKSDKRALESQLNYLIRMREGHQDAGLAPGHMYYQMAWKEANNAITEFCRRWNVPYDSIASGIPQLKVMQDYAEATVVGFEQKAAKYVTMLAGGAVPATVAIVMLAATSHTLYLFLSHWGDKIIMQRWWW